ncbi:MAG: RsmB/NOP family class I SAM-dependent RNA methyltransferase [Lachnospiraceae bacterium]|nr:RsmB/NOP family class I SAM-dependent RNA methyltransferase [Lachnospiraceae bacterium]
MLPQQFLDRMEEMLGEEYEAFLSGYDKPKFQSLRVNPLKGSVQELKEKADFLGEPVPWAKGGFYYAEDARPGKHPYHEAGVYYIQEASAMAPAGNLDVQPGEKVLDLCAAPGGKSTQLAAAMEGRGLIVCNEIHPARAKILSENVERMGISNALVTSHDPAVLAEHFPAYFDKILVDAPCSGEGMFRKNEEAAEEWSPENVIMCGERQDLILESAAAMLRPGGSLVYSTCTFAPVENEGTISRFLAKHPEFSLADMDVYPGMEPGRKVWCEDRWQSRARAEIIEKTIRLWPHKLNGEGHFMAKLVKQGERIGETFATYGLEKGITEKDCKEWQEFAKEFLKRKPEGKLLKFGDQLYLAPEEMPSLKGLKVLRAGLHLGTLKKNRFEPSHALALYLKPEQASYRYALSVETARTYLAGQTFPAEGEKGWYLLTVDGYSLGWGKLAGGIMKNHYPKGIRKNS